MSAPRDDALFVGHIRDAAAQVESYLDGVSRERFLDSPMIQDAVIRQIMIIGEAANNLSPRWLRSRPDIPWADIIGMRHKLVHDYIEVDVEVVWKTATSAIPLLAAQLAPPPP